MAESERSVLIVLDASGSMNQRLPEGRTRLEAAKAAVADMVNAIAPDTRLALRLYGHQSTPDKKNCRDSELIARFAPVKDGKATLLDQVANVEARGYTPTTLSLRLGAGDIAAEASAARTLVLVSDGRETCSADPCVAAKALAAADAKLVIHTIGLGVDAPSRSQLQCIAGVARGAYFDARSQAELATLMGQAAVTPKRADVTLKVTGSKTVPSGVLHAPGMREHALIYEAETGKAVLKGIGGPFPKQELPAGLYSVKLINGAWTGIEIKADEETVFYPAILRIEGQSSENINLLDPETKEVVGYFNPLTTREAALLPGRFIPRIGKFDWPAIDLMPNQTTVLRLSNIKVNDPFKTVQYYKVTPVGGGPEELFLSNRLVALPRGRYFVWHNDAPSEKAQIDIADGQTVEIRIQRN